MKILIVDDDFISRSVLLRVMNDYGYTDVAVSAKEAIEAIEAAYKNSKPYNLIFLDRIMPEEKGDSVLLYVREFEKKRKLTKNESAVIIMTTCVDDPKEVLASFKDQCEGYLIKPIDRAKLLETVQKCGIELKHR